MLSETTTRGVTIAELTPGESLMVTTVNRTYSLTYLGHRQALLSGHPEFCQTPTQVRIEGSTWGGSMIEMGFLGEGMHLEFSLRDGKALTTSTVVEITRAGTGDRTEWAA